MEKLKQTALERPANSILYVLCRVLKEIGVDEDKLEGIPDERPVPVKAGDLLKLLGDEPDDDGNGKE